MMPASRRENSYAVASQKLDLPEGEIADKKLRRDSCCSI
jgi:hypothetical protein